MHYIHNHLACHNMPSINIGGMEKQYSSIFLLVANELSDSGSNPIQIFSAYVAVPIVCMLYTSVKGPLQKALFKLQMFLK